MCVHIDAREGGEGVVCLLTLCLRVVGGCADNPKEQITEGNAFNTLFITALNYETDEATLKREFEVYVLRCGVGTLPFVPVRRLLTTPRRLLGPSSAASGPSCTSKSLGTRRARAVATPLSSLRRSRT